MPTPYGPTARRMLAALRSRGLLDGEALAAHVRANGHDCTKQVVSQWVTGDAHLPFDVAPILGSFIASDVGNKAAEELVLGPLIRAFRAALGVEDDPVTRSEPEALHSLASAMARLQVALLEARDPSSADGGSISAQERQELLRQGRNLRVELDVYMASLNANDDQVHALHVAPRQLRRGA